MLKMKHSFFFIAYSIAQPQEFIIPKPLSLKLDKQTDFTLFCFYHNFVDHFLFRASVGTVRQIFTIENGYRLNENQ